MVVKLNHLKNKAVSTFNKTIHCLLGNHKFVEVARKTYTHPPHSIDKKYDGFLQQTRISYKCHVCDRVKLVSEIDELDSYYAQSEQGKIINPMRDHLQKWDKEKRKLKRKPKVKDEECLKLF